MLGMVSPGVVRLLRFKLNDRHPFAVRFKWCDDLTLPRVFSRDAKSCPYAFGLQGMHGEGILHAKDMATVTIKTFPDRLLNQLRARAASARRSTTQEILTTLEASFSSLVVEPRGDREEANRQADAWTELSGKWKSNLTAQEEINRLYKARSRGRKVSL
jgi:plasmid stability protein